MILIFGAKGMVGSYVSKVFNAIPAIKFENFTTNSKVFE